MQAMHRAVLHFGIASAMQLHMLGQVGRPFKYSGGLLHCHFSSVVVHQRLHSCIICNPYLSELRVGLWGRC